VAALRDLHLHLHQLHQLHQQNFVTIISRPHRTTAAGRVGVEDEGMRG
jgi:hypothetical protein